MLHIEKTTKFRKDLKRLQKQHKPMAQLLTVIERLSQRYALPPRNRDHSLTGNWEGFRECHIQPD
jgi:mRNA interferase YafQ